MTELLRFILSSARSGAEAEEQTEKEKVLGVWVGGYLEFQPAVLLISCSTEAFGAAPTALSTSCPSLKKRRVGMLMILYLPATPKFSSVFSLPNATLPFISFEMASIVGDSILHGPHHGAQQSTTTIGYFFTVASKSESVTTTGESGNPLPPDGAELAIFIIS